ncbi:MAG: pseudaminic acid cytidylyltransferase [Candidatus Omnitrophota bacterium]
MNNTLAIITARSGSKRIPRKNIKEFLGFPIIKYSIEAAIESKCFDEIMVSTDDKEIALISEKYSAKVPFFRSNTSSGDFATTADVIEEVLLEYRKRGKVFEYCCCIYPTAPFVTFQRLQEAFNMLKKSNADSVIPVVCFSYPVQRALKIDDGKLSMIWPENLYVRSQDLISTYHDAGQFYWLNAKAFLENKNIFTNNTVPIEIRESEAQDLDSEEDWKMAELKYRILKGLL